MELDTYQVGEKPFPGNYHMVGQSDVMRKLYSEIEDFADSNATVLLWGESGTGKELVAKAIHENSPRMDKRYIPLNCAAFPRDLLESQLFGHKKGAFTGAHIDKYGILKAADGGTVFLDEIIHMDVAIQGKLLRAVEEGTFIPIGYTTEEKVNVRYISATSKSNEELQGLMEREEFLKELFYRLNVIGIDIPPLREREDDIPLLIEYFLNFYNIECKKSKSIDPDAMNVIESYRWPGNVREMMSIVNRLVLKGKNNRVSYEDVMNQPEFKEPGDYDIIMRRINILAKNQKGLHLDFDSVKDYLEGIREGLATNQEEVCTYFSSIKDILEGRKSYTPEEYGKIMDALDHPKIKDLVKEVKGLGDRMGGFEGRFGGIEDRMEGIENRGVSIEGGVKALGERMDELGGGVKALGERMDDIEGVKDVAPVVEETLERKRMRHMFRDGEDGREYSIKELVKATGIPRAVFYNASGKIGKNDPTIDDMFKSLEGSKYRDRFSLWMEESRRGLEMTD